MQGRYVHLVYAIGLAAGSATEVYMVVVMLVLCTGFFAERVFYGTTLVVYAVQQAFLLKRVQCAVQRDAVVLLAKLLLYGRVGQRMVVLQEQVQHVGAALGFTQTIGVYDLMKFVHAGSGRVCSFVFKLTNILYIDLQLLVL